jgi:hypothetical protein
MWLRDAGRAAPKLKPIDAYLANKPSETLCLGGTPDRIPGVNLTPERERRMVWAFWIACGLAAVGGLAALVLGGFSSRISGAAIPYLVAAIAFGALARFHRQGRGFGAILYFVAGLAIVYGTLQMISLPLRLTLIGTCPPTPAQCLAGFERPISEGELTGIWFAAGMGIVAIFVGYFGLHTMLRRPVAHAAPTSPVGIAPPVRTIPPVEDAPEKESKPTNPAPPPSGTE